MKFSEHVAPTGNQIFGYSKGKQPLERSKPRWRNILMLVLNRHGLVDSSLRPMIGSRGILV
jgi:hypothetical protein